MSAGIRLFHHPPERLRATVDEQRSYPVVTPRWAAPLSHPDHYLALLDEKGQEIAMIRSLDDLDPDSRRTVEIELRRRYLAATITGIERATVQFGATYWHVRTDRGPRDFVTQSLQENAQWLSERQLVLVDVDGNRFEIPDVRALDARSAAILESIL
jgi:hypothetical protein